MAAILSETLLKTISTQSPLESRFLTNTFFSNSQVYNADTLRIDEVRDYAEDDSIVPYVGPLSEGSFDFARAHVAHEFKYPLINHTTEVPYELIADNVPGKTEYDLIDLNQNLTDIAAKNVKILKRKVENTIEHTIAQLLFTGSFKNNGYGDNFNLTYWDQNNKPETNVATKWDQGNATPLKDLEVLMDKLSMLNLNHSMAIMNRKTYTYLHEHLRTLKDFDMKDFKSGHIEPRHMNSNVTYMGTLLLANLDIWTYTGSYYDAGTKTRKTFIPDGKILITPQEVNTQLAFGAWTVSKNKSYIRKKGKYDFNLDILDGVNQPANLTIMSRPLPIIYNPQQFHVVNVL